LVAGLRIKLARGECFQSVKDICNVTGLSRQQVRRCVSLLQEGGEIATNQVANRGLHVKIANYDIYNDEGCVAQPVTQPTGNQPATNRQPTIQQEGKEVKKGKNRNPPKSPQGESVDFPESLKTHDGFMAIWREWLSYRRESHFKPFKPVGLRNHLAMLAREGPDRSIQAIRITMEQGYQGVQYGFKALDGGNGRPTRSQSATPKFDLG
jgi:hypothetical protein